MSSRRPISKNKLLKTNLLKQIKKYLLNPFQGDNDSILCKVAPLFEHLIFLRKDTFSLLFMQIFKEKIFLFKYIYYNKR